jgi:hypothetical protein
LTENARAARFQARIHSGNQLTNTPLTSFAVVQCDPMSDDADIGILSCGPGSECVVDERGSSLGGVCVTTARELQQESAGIYCELCSFGFTLASEHYDHVLDIPEAGYEGITGRELKDAAYVTYTMDATTCSVVTEAVRAAGLCNALCDLCGFGSSVAEGEFDLPVTVSGAGYDAATCGGLSTASYFNATIPTSSCPAVAEAAKSAGCCSPMFCVVCPYNSTFGNGDVFPLVGTTCGDLLYDAYINGTISDDACPAAVQLAETEGCCVAMPTYDFNVCGDATFYPDNKTMISGTCEESLPLFNATRCALYTPDFARFCCSTPSGISSVVPTPAPQESTPSEPGAPNAAPEDSPSSPTSKSAAMWSTSTLVSLMGVTAATTAAALILN